MSRKMVSIQETADFLGDQQQDVLGVRAQAR
jgi:hypothetical protein